jgi:glycosyltransferase involved in cell wall biosynthesis
MKEEQQSVSLSVIVPCYNVEQYLDRSLGCLERQWDGRTDYEIILVNDASSDGTIHKLNEFKNRYPNNVIVIDKAVNEGVGMARNSGLDIASGKWIAFMDPDDALIDNAYSSLLQLTEQEQFDLLSFDATVIEDIKWNDSLTKTRHQKYEVDWCGKSKEFMLNYQIGTCFRFLYRRLLLNHRFKDLIFLEDVVFVLPLFLRDSVVALTNENVYLYIVRKSSTTNFLNVERLNKGCDDVVVALQMMDEMKQNQNSAIQNKITDRQNFYGYNLFTRLLLSGKNKSQLRQIRTKMDDMSLLPFMGAGLKTKFYNFLFRHLNLMLLFRPVYRQIRKR